MSLSRFLLGSTAVLMAASGARAADAVEVMPEPEPMEYVGVCDTYGPGFYYIPGTETCLRVGGYLRYDIGVGIFGHQDVLDKQDLASGIINTNDTYSKRARAALQLDARSETELGTLRGYMHINFNWDTDTVPAFVDTNGNGISEADEFVGDLTTTSTGTEIEHAYIELGGFRIGKTDSLFSSITNFAGGVLQDDLIDYEADRTHQISYTFSGSNGFTASIGLEEGAGDLYTIDSYVPHVVAGAALTQGWGGVSAAVAYDSVWEEWAAKLRLDVKASENLSLFVMGGYSSTDTGSYYATWDGDWAVWGGGTYQVNDKASVNVQLSYDDSEAFAAVANVSYELVKDLTITPEIAYYDADLGDSDSDDGFGGFLAHSAQFLSLDSRRGARHRRTEGPHRASRQARDRTPEGPGFLPQVPRRGVPRRADALRGRDRRHGLPRHESRS